MRSQKRNQNLKSRIASAEKMSADDLFKKLSCKMTTAAKIFTKMQYSQTRKKPSGRRFTLEEKVLSLSLYKKSPRSYPLLAKFFTLPSTKSLKRLLTKIEVEPGLNKCIFLKIKNTVKDLSPEDRLCSLIFDEMSISPQIHYNAAKDLLRGFTINGEKIADHVLVFMVKGLRKKFKQPIAYYFTNALNKAQLKEILKKVVSYVRSTGLKVVCTVCDQSTVNDNNKIRLIETKAIPSIKNLIRTIEGIQQIWILLSQTYSFDAMLTRNFNQDPLENFFGNIRSYGARNTAPDTVAFEGAFKSLLINNFNSPHSLHANCEKDEDNCLQNLDFFLKENSVLAPSTSDIPSPIDEEEPSSDHHNIFCEKHRCYDEIAG
ncbi:hypothetical protein SFRURICE_006595 [Spodoptera frugiperda]|nr:hypothetical protein SFRURICE_006595 [Spodoptera frugiperda]